MTIKIPLQSAERVTIIHGPNGFGKTVILKMIAGMVGGKTSIFEHTPFDEFSVTLDDGSSRIIRRSVGKGQPGKPEVKLEFLTRGADGNVVPVRPLPAPEIPKQVLSQIDRKVPGPYRLSGSGWTDGSEMYSLEEILEMFPQAAEVVPRQYRPGVIFDLPQDLQVFFVETNRLATEAPRPRQMHLFPENYVGVLGGEGAAEPPASRVRHYSDDIVQRIRTALTDYARHSQDRDRTFPERLVRLLRDGYKKLPEREILNKMAELEIKRRRLISLGLLDSESGLRDLTEEDVLGFLLKELEPFVER